MIEPRALDRGTHFVQDFKALERLLPFKKCLLIYDNSLLKIPSCRSLILKFSFRYGVQAGEILKDLRFYPRHLDKIFKILPPFSRNDFSVVALGGGSVGDFAGFFASTLHRGVGFIQIPSTWLAAIDSSHGGKTALNFRGLKNQIGTFYFPRKTIIHLDFLPQDSERFLEAAGELLKSAFLAGSSRNKILHLDHLDAFQLWKGLPLAVSVKMRFVKKDPFEQKGVRVALNLGHTLAHAFERNHGLSHGIAVLFGLEFALKWSVHRRVLSQRDYVKIANSSFVQSVVAEKQNSRWKNLNLSILLKDEAKILSCIQRDKKRSSNLGKVGRTCEIFISKKSYKILEITDEQFAKEIQRQRTQNEFLF